MNKYNEQYYIAMKPYGSGQLSIKADQNTSKRGYHYKKVPLGGEPFFFHNANREYDRKHGHKWPVTDVLMIAGNLLVSDVIRQELMKHDIPGMQLYPSVYVDDDGEYHENYWFLNFYEQYKYWDEEQSVIRILDYDDDDEEFEEDDDEELEEEDAEVRQYSLDESKLDEIPEEKRLMFKMGGVNLPYVFVHQKIVDFFLKNKFRGIRFIKVSEFKEGCQYRS